MDLLESGDERADVPVRVRLQQLLGWQPPAWAVALLAVALLATVGAGAVTAGEQRAEQDRQAVRVDAELVPGRGSSSTVGGVAQGELTVVLRNARDVPVRVEAVAVEISGLEVRGVEPAGGTEVAGGAEQVLQVRYEVPDCSRLQLPGRLVVSLATAGGPVVQRLLPIVTPDQDPGGAVVLGACPASAVADPPGSPTDIGLRPAGGPSERDGAGAGGVARIEVRNGGARVTLLSVEAEFPGVAFDQRRLGDGRSLSTDEVVVIQLGFRIADCAVVGSTGRLIVTVERGGAEQQLVLRLGEPANVQGEPRLDLPVLLGACG